MVAILYSVQLLQREVDHLLVEVVEVVVAAISKALPLALETPHLHLHRKVTTEAWALHHIARLVGLAVAVEVLVQLARRQLADRVRERVA
jgi:hypothetical protein